MYYFNPSPDLLPVMPGTRLYSVDTDRFTLDDEEFYAEGVVVTEDSLLVILNGEMYELGEGLYLSREEALDWIEKNKKPTALETLATVFDRLLCTHICNPGRTAS